MGTKYGQSGWEHLSDKVAGCNESIQTDICKSTATCKKSLALSAPLHLLACLGLQLDIAFCHCQDQTRLAQIRSALSLQLLVRSCELGAPSPCSCRFPKSSPACFSIISVISFIHLDSLVSCRLLIGLARSFFLTLISKADFASEIWNPFRVLRLSVRACYY